MWLYIYDNETGEQIDAIHGINNEECEARADEMYGSNDYQWSYSNVE